MIADLIQQSKRFGHKAGENWTLMIHDDTQVERMGEKLHESLVAYKENLEFLLVQCQLAFEMHAREVDLKMSTIGITDVDESKMNYMDQCVAWLRGEIKELEKL